MDELNRRTKNKERPSDKLGKSLRKAQGRRVRRGERQDPVERLQKRLERRHKSLKTGGAAHG